jgi:hypothetical protein
MVMRAIPASLRAVPPEEGREYAAFVDMSGGSLDDATLGIAHREIDGRFCLELLISQDGGVPIDPSAAVRKFVRALRQYGLERVTGDAYAGQTFRFDFEQDGIEYRVSDKTKTDHYEALEPRLNAGKVELLDLPKLQEQLLTLVVRSARVDHPPGGHDDWANTAAGCIEAAEKVSAQLRPRKSNRRLHRPQTYSPFNPLGSDPLAEYR